MEFTILQLVLVVGVGIAIWGLTTSLLSWGLPSGDLGLLWPAIVGAFVGLMWSRQLVEVPTLITDGAGAVIGCFLVLYIVIRIATPGHGSAVINLFAQGPLETGFKTSDPGPWIWPVNMVVKRRGSIIWHLNANQRMKVTIRFPDGSPFEKSIFSRVLGDGSEVILAAPIVNTGTFVYEVKVVDEHGNVFAVDPKVKIPKGGG